MDTTGSIATGAAVDAARTPGGDRAGATDVPLLRHLGLAERLFYLYGERTSVNFSLVAEIEGPLAAEAVASAFRQVVGRHPLLSTRVGPGPTGQLAFLGGRQPPQVEIRRVARTEWPTFTAKDVARPLGDDEAVFFKGAVLLEEDAAAVILTFHHAVANGRSAVTVLTDLLAALVGRTLIPTAPPASLESYAGVEDRLSDYSRPVKRSTVMDGTASRRALPEPRIATLSVGRDDTEALRGASRANGATVHGALCAALATVLARRGSGFETKILSAVDLSETVGAPHDVCAFLNGAVVTPVAAGCDFWESARSISATAAAYREPASVRQQLQGMAPALPADATPDVAVAILEGALGADLEVTNLGALAVDLSYDDLTITGIRGPVPYPKTEGAPIVAVVGLAGGLRLTQTFLGEADPLLDDLRACLIEIARSVGGYAETST